MDNDTRKLEELLAQRASRWVEVVRDPSPSDRVAFVAWLKESPRNVRDFLVMLHIDQALDHVDVGRMHDIESLLAQADGRIVKLSSLPMRHAAALPTHRRLKSAAVAAGLVLAAVAAWMAVTRFESGWQTFATSTSEQRAFELDDGSVITLNTHSRAAIRMSVTARDVRLIEGEALFRVHHDTARPFRVFTTDAVIQAVGTQFNVYERRDGTVVSVIEGRVNVTPASPTVSPASDSHSSNNPGPRSGRLAPPHTVLVSSSEEAQIAKGGEMNVRTVTDVADAVAWRARRVIFRERRLDFIAEEFNRYSRKKIVLDGPGVESRVYTGVFDADDVESLAQVLARDPALVVDNSQESITVKVR